MHLAKDTPKNEIEDFVNNLTADQMKKLSGFYNSMPRLEHKVKVTNPKTKVESEVTLKGLASFFGCLSHMIRLRIIMKPTLL